MVCFQSEREAKEFGKVLDQRPGKFTLKIAKDKGRIIESGHTVWQKAQRQVKKVAIFEFLGSTHYGCRTEPFKVGRKTARKKFIEKMKQMNQWLTKVRNLAGLKE